MWCGDCTLKKAFPYLFCVSRARDSLVAEVMCWFGGRMHCNFQFCHPLQDWEKDSFDRIMDIIYSSKVQGVGLDKVWWKPTKNKGFEARSFYLSFYPPTIFFPWRLVWQSKVPPRVAFLGKILTTDNLRKRRIIVID